MLSSSPSFKCGLSPGPFFWVTSLQSFLPLHFPFCFGLTSLPAIPQTQQQVPTSGPLHLLFPLLGMSLELPCLPSGLCSDVTFSVQPFLTPIKVKHSFCT